MGTISGNALVMKEININMVRESLKTVKKATKQELARMTGLSLVTVGTVLQQLLISREVREDEMIPSGGGRPARRYCYNQDFQHVLIIYGYDKDGRDQFNIRVIDLFGEAVYGGNTTFDELYPESFESVIEHLIGRYPTISAIGFGLPGFELNHVLTVSDYKHLEGQRLRDHYQNRFKLPVVIVNDVNAAVVGYCTSHIPDECYTTAYLYFPENHPPGAGIYINKMLYVGNSHFAGEINVLPFDVDWYEFDYKDFQKTNEILAKVIITMISILNPRRIVLHGEFLTDRHIRAILEACEQVVGSAFLPDLYISGQFQMDYERGVIASTLGLLSPTLKLNS